MTATVAIALLAGLAIGAVAAVGAAARRAQTSLDRFLAKSDGYDAVVGGCPPGVDPSTLDGSQQSFLDLCTNAAVAERLRTEVVATLPGVTSADLLWVNVVGLLDPASPNGWGHGVLVYSMGAHAARPIVVSGRLPDPAATDEVVVGERAARAANLRVGQVLRIASWPQATLDAAVDGDLAPQTASFESRLVGIVRQLQDAEGGGSDTGTFLPDGVLATDTWARAHADGLAGYGVNVGVHLLDGAAGWPALQEGLDASGWFSSAEPGEQADLTAFRRSLAVERQAVMVAAAIGAVAVALLVSLVLVAQLRRELGAASDLVALGMTRSALLAGAIVRGTMVMLPAAVLGSAVAVAASPLGPYGLARRIEFDHPVRADTLVVTSTLAVAVALAALAGFLATRRVTRRATAAPRATRTRLPVGAVGRAGLSFAHGSSARVGSAVVAVALGATVLAAGLVADLDRVLTHPTAYGAWWTVAVGQYSDPAALEASVERVRANPAVSEAAGVYDTPDGVAVDGLAVPLMGYEPYVGNPLPVLAAGRAPTGPREVALGRSTARHLGKGVGDTVLVAPLDASTAPVELSVVGVAVLDNPVTESRNAGDGAFVSRDVAVATATAIPQSIVVRLDPRTDQAAALAALSADFAGSLRTPAPQADLVNLQRLRRVPWLLAGLVVALALGALLYVLAALLRRHRGDLAVLSATGMTGRQRLTAGAWTATAVTVVGAVVGLPAGVVASRVVWRSVADRIAIPARSGVPWLSLVLSSLAIGAVTATAALVSGWWQQRRPVAEALRAE